MTAQLYRAEGIVLDPVQFAQELTTLKQRPGIKGHALLCELPEAVVQQLEDPQLPHRIAMSLNQTPWGLLYVVIRLQAAAMQLVCVVPMASEVAGRWFIDTVEQQRRAMIAVNITETQQLALLRSTPLVDDTHGEDWRETKALVTKLSFDVDPEVRGMDIRALMQELEPAPRSLIPGLPLESMYVVDCMPDPSYTPTGCIPGGSGQWVD